MKHTERTVTELASLFRMLQVMPDADNVGRIYQMLLAFCTTWHTIGFRRGILMLVHPRQGEIRGHLAAEPDPEPGGEDAASEATFEAMAKDVFQSFERIEGSDLTVKARTFSVPLDWHRSAVVKAVLFGYPVLAEGRMSEFATDPYFTFFGARCYIALPIKIDNRVVAVLAADNGDSGDPISVDDVSLAYSLSQQAGIAAERLLESIDNKRKFRVLDKLQDILRNASTPEQLSEAINLSLSMICRAVAGSGCLLKDRVRNKTTHVKTVDEATLDADDGDIALSRNFESILDRCAGRMKQIRGDEQYPLLDERSADELRCFHAFPLRAVEECYGALAVYVVRDEGSRHDKKFPARDRVFLELAAGIIAARLHAYRQSERLARAEVLQDELRSHLARERGAARTGDRAADYYAELAGRIERIREIVFSCSPYKKRIEELKTMLDDAQREMRAAAKDLTDTSVALRTVDLFGLVRSVVAEWEPRVTEHNVEVTVRIPEDGPKLLMDRDSVSTALHSILRTVSHSVADGDRVMVECSNTDERVHLCIADTGRGLPGNLMSRLFMPFAARGEDEDKNALSIAGKILQQHAGEISLKSTTSWNTVLVISFPIAANKDRRSRRQRRRRAGDRRSFSHQ